MSKLKECIKKHTIISWIIVVAIAIISVGIFAPIIAPYSPFEGNLSDALQPPSSEHIFGTDKLGRDVFSRVVYGTRISLTASLVLVISIFTIHPASSLEQES